MRVLQTSHFQSAQFAKRHQSRLTPAPVKFGLACEPGPDLCYPCTEGAALWGGVLSATTVPLWQAALRKFRRTLVGAAVIGSGAMAGTLIAYLSNKRNERALQTAKQDLEATIKAYGSSHPKTAKSMTKLGAAYYFMGKRTEARHLFQASLLISAPQLGDNHPSVKETKFWLSLL